jgi:hypothetical protein
VTFFSLSESVGMGIFIDLADKSLVLCDD